MTDTEGDASGTLCPIARSSGLAGDRWTILIVRELSFGSTRFDQLQVQTGATPQLLTLRLRRLEADGMVVREPYSQRPLRHEYRLTDKGRDFIPVLFAFRAFGEKWCKAQDEPLAVRTFHRECGGEVGLDGECATCHAQVPFKGLQVAPSQAYIDERRRRAGG